MNSSPEDTNTPTRRTDTDYWAQPVDRLRVTGMPESAVNLVEGRQLVGPLQGFGKMWQKTYRVRLEGSDLPATDVISTWKQNFSSFWPKGNRFYAPLVGIQPGEVALVSIAAGPVKLSTGVMVLYADPESFTLMTPQGHMFAGWITFSAVEDEGTCVAQTQVLMRAQDPVSELGLTFGGHKQEDRFWQQTLKALALNWGVDGKVVTEVVCVDPGRKWSQAKNIWHNAAIRSQLHVATAPVRLLTKPLRRRSPK